MTSIGIALGTYLGEEGKRSVLIGNDVRTSSVLLSRALTAGVLSTGIDVTDVGTSSFGLCAFSGWFLRKDAIAYITASHLPPEFNGVKFYTREGIGFSEEDNRRIKKIFFEQSGIRERWDKAGDYNSISLIKEYFDHLSGMFTHFEGMKIILDCGNGSMSLVAPGLFRKMGMSVTTLFCDVDPAFPNRSAEPTEENLTALKKHIPGSEAEFDIAFDGDGDRVAIFDEKGRLLTPDQCGVILAMDLLSSSQQEKTILANVECSMLIEEIAADIGAEVVRIPVGHIFLTIEAKRRKALIGIESSGHYVMPSYFPFDDAVLVPLKIAEVLLRSGRSLSAIVDGIPKYPKIRINVECDERIKFRVIDLLSEELSKEYDVSKLDGVRIDLDDGWVLIRASNTSPLIRITVEGKTEERMEALRREFVEITEKAIKRLR